LLRLQTEPPDSVVLSVNCIRGDPAASGRAMYHAPLAKMDTAVVRPVAAIAHFIWGHIKEKLAGVHGSRTHLGTL
jgi:hypothetical protein